MLSQEAELALERLTEGVVMNPVHTVARELINEGLALNDWGRLALTEAGWVRARRRIRSLHEIIDPNISDMAYQNPMGLGPEVPVDMAAAHVVIESAPPETVRPLSYYDRAIAAAGVASGKTGEWPTPAWVHAFMEAFDEQ